MKRMVCMLLCAALLAASLPWTALAAEADAPLAVEGTHPAETVEFDSPSYALTARERDASPSSQEVYIPTGDSGYVDMESSQSLVDIIKDCEGFSPTPYWDHSQWSIGYGTGCGSTREEVPSEYWDGITEEQGEQLLRDYLENSAEKEVNDFYRSIGRQPLQQQFDAMVDFTYALGGSWIYGSRVRDYLTNPTNELELMRALGAWCRVDGKVSVSTCCRRIREALIYAYGLYTLPYGGIDSEVEVVADSDLPIFRYVIFDGDGAILVTTRTDDVNYYLEGDDYSSLIKPAKDNAQFYGWVRSNGTLLLDGQSVEGNLRVTARWETPAFSDVSADNWFSQGVTYCNANSLLVGTSATTFSPAETTTRGMVVTVLYRMAGSPQVSAKSGLSDIDGQDRQYYTDAVCWAVEKGLAYGYGDGTFRPNQSVTRAEMVSFLCRYVSSIGGLDTGAPTDVLDRYVDKDQVPSYAVGPICWALDQGLIVGTSTDPYTLSPNNTANRAQLAKVIMVVDNLIKAAEAA